MSRERPSEGNSFIPRLWARMYLDTLLEQGGSPAVKDEIIALSEEYHIITPYTSLLVLETDADRERFGVKRRFQMRDGEKFFAAGPRKRQLGIDPAADEAGRHLAAGAAAGRVAATRPLGTRCAGDPGCSTNSLLEVTCDGGMGNGWPAT